jgi:putative phosphoesterase
MRIAFFSDIHGNLAALDTAFRAARQHGASRVVVAGDLVGDGPCPAEVVRRLMQTRVACIRGNVDRRVLDLAARPGRLRKVLKGKKSPARRNEAWTASQLAPDELEWLAALPAELELDVEGRRVRVVHGSPVADTDYIYPSITPEALHAKLDDDRPDVLVCGHSHVPFTARVAEVRVVNCGSVGRPADGDPRGSFALVDFSDPTRVASAIVRFAYPVRQTTAALVARDVPGTDADEYERGIKR